MINVTLQFSCDTDSKPASSSNKESLHTISTGTKTFARCKASLDVQS